VEKTFSCSHHPLNRLLVKINPVRDAKECGGKTSGFVSNRASALSPLPLSKILNPDNWTGLDGEGSGAPGAIEGQGKLKKAKFLLDSSSTGVTLD
jgi:hypothetical protein